MWTRKLPTVPGYYWFRDIDTLLEEGIGYVYPPDARGDRRASVLIPVSKIDGAEPYISDVMWRADETETDIWEWYGPICVG